MIASITNTDNQPCCRKQHGAVLMVMLVIIILSTTAILVSALSRAALQANQDKITTDALAFAREALISFASSVKVVGTNCAAPGNNCKRLGDLPCPDIKNDGIANSSCDAQVERLGRLPWKTLGIPDLRDASGERLWYAVSTNFKNNTRTICTSPGQVGCLNSDSAGTITIRRADGSIVNDASLSSGVVAVIIAPGKTLKRQGAASLQNRNCTVGVDCDATDVCLTTAAPTCDPLNYLDNTPAGINADDNADFIDGSSANGFIQGIIKDINSNILINDQLMSITQVDIMQSVQKRVAAEVRNCLNEYAATLQNKGRYPWASAFTGYADTSNQLFGRIPDTPFTTTNNDSKMGMSTGMTNTWGVNCNIYSGTSTGWWVNWKELVFYGLANGYKPIYPLNTPAICSGATCLTVNPPPATADKKYVVIIAGKAIPSLLQLPRISSNPATYLESGNESADQSGTFTFIQGSVSSTFNDTVVSQQ